MELEMVLNELSLQPLARSIPEARQRMSNFIETMTAATRAGTNRSLRTDENFNTGLQLAPGYLLVNWLNDHEVDREAQRYFKSLTTRAPYLVGIDGHIVDDKIYHSEFFYNGTSATGLGIAYFLDALALSICSDACWNFSRLDLNYTYLDSEGEDIREESVTVTHASHKDHILEHITWIKERTNPDIQNGSDLWRHRESLFPNLQFCASVDEALQFLNSGADYLHLVRKKLSELEKACLQWQEREGSFDVQLKGSVDSEVALQKYAEERTFVCPDGQSRLFSLHIRVTSSWRIYYYPLGSTKKVIVGYIGKHLSTKKYS